MIEAIQLNEIDNLIEEAAKAGKKSVTYQTWDADTCTEVEARLKAKGFTIKHSFDSKNYLPDPAKKGEYLVEGIHYLTISW